MATDFAIRDHQSWLGYLQPEGLVVSPAALVDAQVVLDANVAARQHQFLTFVQDVPKGDDTVPAIVNLQNLLMEFLEWPEDRLLGRSTANPIPESLKVPLRDFGETLEPTLAFIDSAPADPDRPWILLVKELEFGTPLDVPIESQLSGWSASPTRRFERLLRESGVPIGLLGNRELYRRLWWQHAEKRIELYLAIEGMNRVLAINCGATPHMSFTFLESGMVYANTLVVVAFDNNAAFAALQSRVHEVWTRRESSSMKDDLRYTSTDCFETFPFPTTTSERDPHETDSPHSASLDDIGRQYFEFRATLMIRHDEGLTKTYNRFHDRDHDSTELDTDKVAGVQELRRLHAAMDDVVLRAYDWNDLADRATCEFLLDYEEDESEEETSSRRKKPWRYRWPDEFRDEVLARLLALNAQRATEERLAGATTNAAPKRATKKKATKGKAPSTTSAAPKKARKKRAKGDREMF
jgi:hypothetical protein